MNVVGIDPVKSGAVAVLTSNEQRMYDCPTISINGKRYFDESGMATLIRVAILSGAQAIFMEQVHAMPKQGVVSMFSLAQRRIRLRMNIHLRELIRQL